MWDRFKTFLTLSQRIFAGRQHQSIINGVSFRDLREDRGVDSDQVEQVLADAIAFLRSAGGGYDDVLGTYLRKVVAVDVTAEIVSVRGRTYFAGFQAWERRSSVYFASKLVFGGNFIRDMLAYPWFARSRMHQEVQARARQVQIVFLRQFPDTDVWIAVLKDLAIPGA